MISPIVPKNDIVVALHAKKCSHPRPTLSHQRIFYNLIIVKIKVSSACDYSPDCTKLSRKLLGKAGFHFGKKLSYIKIKRKQKKINSSVRQKRHNRIINENIDEIGQINKEITCPLTCTVMKPPISGRDIKLLVS